jgi:hypothetical protein
MWNIGLVIGYCGVVFGIRGINSLYITVSNDWDHKALDVDDFKWGVGNGIITKKIIIIPLKQMGRHKFK